MKIGAESLPPEPSLPTAAPEPEKAAAAGGIDFAAALRQLGGAVDQGEGLIDRTTRGSLGQLDAAQLIALQAGIYRYSEAVDLTAKLVDRAANAVRTVLSPH
jgi:hypothetical protein